jgi:hypothetical protein
VGLERDPLSLVSTTEELLGRKSSGGRSVGIVRSRTQTIEFSFSFNCEIISLKEVVLYCYLLLF